MFPVGSLVQHVATGRVYGIKGHATVEAFDALAYVYLDHPGGERLWVRGKKDMEDGRFIAAAIHVIDGRAVAYDPSLKARREALGLTQDDVAEKLGCSRSRVSHLEQGLVPINSPWTRKAQEFYTLRGG
jgi:DNA-binding XRE family transcriptional regulator